MFIYAILYIVPNWLITNVPPVIEIVSTLKNVFTYESVVKVKHKLWEEQKSLLFAPVINVPVFVRDVGDISVFVPVVAVPAVVDDNIPKA
jgi:hypothetical protein